MNGKIGLKRQSKTILKPCMPIASSRKRNLGCAAVQRTILSSTQTSSRRQGSERLREIKGRSEPCRQTRITMVRACRGNLRKLRTAWTIRGAAAVKRRRSLWLRQSQEALLDGDSCDRGE